MFENELSYWKRESGHTQPVLYKYDYKNRVLTIYTTSPGWFIGKAGALYDKHKASIEKEIGYEIEIVFVETSPNVI